MKTLRKLILHAPLLWRGVGVRLSSGKRLYKLIINSPMINQPWSLPRFPGVGLFLTTNTQIKPLSVRSLTTNKNN